MRIVPDHSRLRIVALVCWAFGAWWMLQPGLLAEAGRPPMLAVAGALLAILCLALGVAFWLLGNDRQAGISLDRKGLMLNLGHSSAFITWDNIASLGVCRGHMSLLALGSSSQLGIRLYHPEHYLQSYEARLPASAGLLAQAVRLVRALTGGASAEPGLNTLEDLRQRTGYDVLIPEAQLGGRAQAFVKILEAYKASPEQRRSLPTGVVVGKG